jgi:hypothetical protein
VANRVIDVGAPVAAFGGVLVVGAAEEANVGGAAVASAGARSDVIVLEPRARVALNAVITPVAAA